MSSSPKATGAPGAWRLQSEDVVFMLCDVQEVFRDKIQCMDHLIHACKMMVDAAPILNIPVITSEQYPARLGSTIPELKDGVGFLFEKTTFSMCCPEIKTKLRLLGKRKVVLM